MTSTLRALPAALAVLVLALTLGLATSLARSPDAEAAAQPGPVPDMSSVIDQDTCTTLTFNYFNPGGNIYAYNPFYTTFANNLYPFAYSCATPAVCIGATFLYQQIQLICPGPPASIEVSGPSGDTCASASNYTAKVRDANGLNVIDGTSVSFQVAPFAQITGTANTDGGAATASLTTPTKTAGTLTLTIQAGTVVKTMAIDVSCSAPGTVAYGASSGGSSAPTVIYVMPGGSPPPSGGTPGY